MPLAGFEQHTTHAAYPPVRRAQDAAGLCRRKDVP